MPSTWPPPLFGWEFVPDFDGTSVRAGGAVHNATQVKDGNDFNPTTEMINTIGSTTIYYAHVYPQLRTITGFSCAYNGTGGSFQTSVDTTDGVGGTWVVQKSHAEMVAQGFNALTNDSMRKPINLSGVTGIIGVRVASSGSNQGIRGLHVWGTYTPTAALHLWHATLDQPLTAATGTDHGDLVRGGISDKPFRVKNTHATQTANAIVVAIQTPDYAAAAANSTLVLASVPASTHNIGNLAPGALSAVLTMRRIMSTSAVYGAKGTTRVTAIAGSWT